MHKSDRRVKGLGEVSILVKDLDAMRKFYEEVVGLEVLRRDESFVFFKVAEGYGGHTQNLALFAASNTMSLDNKAIQLNSQETTLHHIALNVALEDFESEKMRLESLGLKVNATVHEWLHVRSLYFADPEGNTLEFVCYDETVRKTKDVKETVMKSENPQPIIVPPGVGQALEILGVTDKLTGDQTGGVYYLFESVLGPGDGNRLHVHRREDEVAYVLEGALEIRLADQTLGVAAGGVAHLPKGIPHALRNPLPTLSRYLFLAIPAGLDRWFDALDAARQAGTLDDAMYRKLSLDYGIEWLESGLSLKSSVKSEIPGMA